MNYLIIALKIFAALVLVILAIYSWVYFSQVRKIERQFGLSLPSPIKKLLAILAMVPMFISLAVILIVFSELLT
jgi:hypothetical protein